MKIRTGTWVNRRNCKRRKNFFLLWCAGSKNVSFNLHILVKKYPIKSKEPKGNSFKWSIIWESAHPGSKQLCKEIINEPLVRHSGKIIATPGHKSIKCSEKAEDGRLGRCCSTCGRCKLCKTIQCLQPTPVLQQRCTTNATLKQGVLRNYIFELFFGSPYCIIAGSVTEHPPLKSQFQKVRVAESNQFKSFTEYDETLDPKCN